MSKGFLPQSFSKTLAVLGSTSDIVKNFTGGTANVVSKGTKYFEIKGKAFVKEEEIRQASSTLLVKAAEIKKLMKALNISAIEAEELLDKQLAKKK